jgi:hypothetical protein
MSKLPSDDPPDDPTQERLEALAEKVTDILTDPLLATTTRIAQIMELISCSYSEGYLHGTADTSEAKAHAESLNWPSTDGGRLRS